MFSVRSEKIAPLLLCLSPLIYFLPATLGFILLAPDDGVIINMPMRVTAARMILAGEFPLWDPYIFGGMPFFAAAQGGVLFPSNWLFLIFPPGVAVNLAMLFAYAVAGLGAYMYARQAGANVWGSFVTGFVFQFSAFMVAPLGHMSSIQAAGFLPWILWAVDGYAVQSKRSRAVLIPIFIALQVFAGHPQTFVYSSILVAAYALVMAVRQWPIGRRYLYCLLMLVAGLGLAAVQIVPSLELRQHSLRENISYAFFSSLSMPPSFLLNLFAPFATGGGEGFFTLPYSGPSYYAEYVGYVGVIALMLALAAPFLKLDRVTFFWTTAAIAALTLALGGFLPFCLYRLAYFVPGLNMFRVSARHLMEVDFALAVLAGRAVTAIVAAPDRRFRKTLVVVGSAVFLVTVFASLRWSFSEQRTMLDALSLPEVWCPLVLSLAGLALMWKLGSGARHAQVVLMILLVVDLVVWGQFSGWRSSPTAAEMFEPSEVIRFLREQQEAQPPFRVLTVRPPRDAPFHLDLLPNTYMLHAIPNAAGDDPLGLRRHNIFTGGMKEWGELFDAPNNLADDRALDLLNVRYLIALRTAEGKIPSGGQLVDEKTIAERWRHTAQFGDLHVYENQRLLPRAWLATRTVALPEAAMLDAIRSGKFADGESWNPSETVLLEAPIDLAFDPSGVRDVSIVRYDANRIDLQAECNTASMLVLAENFYPGWVAAVDGQEREIIRVNYNQRGIVLEPGRHNVEFDYRPASFSRGVTISLATLLMITLWWIAGLWKRSPISQS